MLSKEPEEISKGGAGGICQELLVVPRKTTKRSLTCSSEDEIGYLTVYLPICQRWSIVIAFCSEDFRQKVSAARVPSVLEDIRVECIFAVLSSHVSRSGWYDTYSKAHLDQSVASREEMPKRWNRQFR